MAERVLHSFRIRTSDWRVPPARWIWVRVHPTQAHMAEAAYRMAPYHGRDFHKQALGCFQGTPTFERWDEDRKRWQVRHRPCAGTLRLVDGHVTSEIVAHELIHAACQVYRGNVARSIRLEQDCGPREEQLAYIYGELFASFQEGWEAWLGSSS
jgi:hypothetical protein